MCGIAGVYRYSSGQPVDRVVLKTMCDSISHRGPDDEGQFYSDDQGVAFGHRRLSIIDLASGAQPMCNKEETIWLVFNGEIYNYRELRKELQRKGYEFQTTSDTEVIIYLYQEYGEGSFERLNGIFAFALFDKRSDALIVARDHFGVKPLYYSVMNGDFVFGSEIKVILQYENHERELDLEALNSFLTFRYNPAPQTLFKGIRKLPPSHYLKISRSGKIQLKNYWNYEAHTNFAISENDAIGHYQDLLEKAVERQMMSDVPIGLLLSGGVDSAVIARLMQNSSASKIKTFSIGFEGKGDYNELDDARETARLVGSEHFEMTISQKQYLDFFYKSFYYTEEPIAEMTIPALYYVSQLASRHVKVVLAGQGADEPLAGYKRYYGEQKLSQFAALARLLPLDLITSMLPRNERIKRAAFAARYKDEIDRFLAIYTIFTPDQKKRLLHRDLQQNSNGTDKALVQSLYAHTSKLHDSLSKILYIDTRMSLSDNLLLFGDKMSMANSIEMRVPFLDVPLVEFLETLPSSFKLSGRTHKYIHKKAVQKWLPESIIHRKKRGFATPMDQWLQQDFSNVAWELFNASDSACRKYFDITYINLMLSLHQSKKENYQRNIFALLSFEIWHKSFFEAKVQLNPAL